MVSRASFGVNEAVPETVFIANLACGGRIELVDGSPHTLLENCETATYQHLFSLQDLRNGGLKMAVRELRKLVGPCSAMRDFRHAFTAIIYSYPPEWSERGR